MNTTFYKNEVEALKKMTQNIESHKPQINGTETDTKSFLFVFGIIGVTIIAVVAFLTWWLVNG